MNAQFYHPETLTGSQLDAFLEAGWYRMHAGLFTTHFIEQQGQIFRVFWLRYNLKDYTAGKTSKKILLLSKNFSFKVKPLELTAEIENLYALYKTNIDFEGAPSVQQWLYGEIPEENIFDSYMVEVRDRNLLIAIGIFDQGKSSIAGIINFYHPDYKKFSLGKLLMIEKIRCAAKAGLSWYYPGYIVHKYPKFDYKLFLGQQYCEVFIPGVDKWYRYSDRVVKLLGDDSFSKPE